MGDSELITFELIMMGENEMIGKLLKFIKQNDLIDFRVHLECIKEIARKRVKINGGSTIDFNTFLNSLYNGSPMIVTAAKENKIDIIKVLLYYNVCMSSSQFLH